MTETSPRLTHLYRYPVKGLTGEALTQLPLLAGEGIEGDRAFAVARAPGVFDPAAPKASPKFNFLMLAKDEALARLTSRYDPADQILRLSEGRALRLEASLATRGGRAEVAAFLKSYLGQADLAPELVAAPGHKFTDISVVSEEKMRAISLVNLASVRALEAAIGQSVDPMRFRANLYFDGVPAWDELNWEGREIGLGAAVAKVVLRTKRCPATEVNPATGKRDINIPAEIRKHFGHFDMGIYAEVQTSGEVVVGDAVEI